jgi:hypothetical protein
MKHLTSLNDFKKSKNSKLTETVFALDDIYRVLPNIDVPKSLINAYIKKVKDETGRDIKDVYGQEQIAEMIVNYLNSAFMNIENLPVAMSMGTNYGKGSQVQPIQGQGQVQQIQQIQPQGQQTQAQQTAQEIPAEGGQGQSLQGQGQSLQGQGQSLQGQGQQGQQSLQGQGQEI